jgi:hypothetical protein
MEQHGPFSVLFLAGACDGRVEYRKQIRPVSYGAGPSSCSEIGRFDRKPAAEQAEPFSVQARPTTWESAEKKRTRVAGTAEEDAGMRWSVKR